jgi:hypothetical protein
MIHAAPGYAGFSLSGAYSVQGGFTTVVKKMEGNMVSMQILSREIKSGAMAVGAYGASMSLSRMKQLASGFGYIMDVSDEAGAEAYEEAMKGNLLAVEELALDMTKAGVAQKVDSTSMILEGSTRSMGIATPILPIAHFRSSKSRMYEHTDKLFFENGVQTTTKYGVFVKEQDGKLGLNHRNVLQAFYGGVAIARDSKGKTLDKNLVGQFVYKYESDNSTSKKLDRNLKILAKKTMLNNLTNLALPSSGKLGYMKVNLGVQFPESFSKALVIANNRAGGLKRFTRAADAAIARVFNTRGMKSDYCNDNETEKRCKRRLERGVKKTFEKIRTALWTMKAESYEKNYVKEFAKFGEHVWSNPFVFAAFTQQGRSCGMRIKFEVTGERVSKYNKELAYPSADCVL